MSQSLVEKRQSRRRTADFGTSPRKEREEMEVEESTALEPASPHKITSPASSGTNTSGRLLDLQTLNLRMACLRLKLQAVAEKQEKQRKRALLSSPGALEVDLQSNASSDSGKGAEKEMLVSARSCVLLGSRGSSRDGTDAGKKEEEVEKCGSWEVGTALPELGEGGESFRSRGEIADLKNLNCALKADLANALTEKEAGAEVVDRLKRELARLRGENLKLQQSENSREMLRASNQELTETVHSLKSQLSNLQLKVGALTDGCVETSEALVRSETARQVLQRKNRELSETITKLQDDLQVKMAENFYMEEEAKRMTAKINALEQGNKRLTTKCQSANGEFVQYGHPPGFPHAPGFHVRRGGISVVRPPVTEPPAWAGLVQGEAKSALFNPSGQTSPDRRSRDLDKDLSDPGSDEESNDDGLSEDGLTDDGSNGGLEDLEDLDDYEDYSDDEEDCCGSSESGTCYSQSDAPDAVRHELKEELRDELREELKAYAEPVLEWGGTFEGIVDDMHDQLHGVRDAGSSLIATGFEGVEDAEDSVCIAEFKLKIEELALHQAKMHDSWRKFRNQLFNLCNQIGEDEGSCREADEAGALPVIQEGETDRAGHFVGLEHLDLDVASDRVDLDSIMLPCAFELGREFTRHPDVPPLDLTPFTKSPSQKTRDQNKKTSSVAGPSDKGGANKNSGCNNGAVGDCCVAGDQQGGNELKYAEIEHLRYDCTLLKKEIMAHMQDRDRLCADLQAVRYEAALLKDEIVRKDEEKRFMCGLYTQWKTQCEENAAKVAELMDKITHLEGQNKMWSEAVKEGHELNSQVENIAHSLQDKNSELENQVSDLKASLSDSQSQVTDLEASLAKSQAENQDSQMRMIDLSTRIEDLTNEVSITEWGRREAKSQTVELSRSVEELTAAVSQKESEKHSAKCQIADLSSTVSGLRKEVLQKTTENERLIVDMHMLHDCWISAVSEDPAELLEVQGGGLGGMCGSVRPTTLKEIEERIAGLFGLTRRNHPFALRFSRRLTEFNEGTSVIIGGRENRGRAGEDRKNLVGAIVKGAFGFGMLVASKKLLK